MQKNGSQLVWLIVAVPAYWIGSILSAFTTKNLVDSANYRVVLPIFIAFAQYGCVCVALAFFSPNRRSANEPFQMQTALIGSSNRNSLPIVMFLAFLLDVSTIRYTMLEFYSAATSLGPVIVALLTYFASKHSTLAKQSKVRLLTILIILFGWLLVIREEFIMGALRLPALVSGTAVAYLRTKHYFIDARQDKRTLAVCLLLLFLTGEIINMFSNRAAFWPELFLSVALKTVAVVAESRIRFISEKAHRISLAVGSFALIASACMYNREAKMPTWVIGNLILIGGQLI